MTAVDERAAEAAGPEIGKARRRKEDQRLITGRTRFTDNLSVAGMLHLGMVRSPVAHARITAVDTGAAKAAPGVVAVLTGADLADKQGSLPCAWPITADQKAPNHPAVAVDHVNFAGEIVAVVVARTAREARDAMELVDVDYEGLPVVLDLETQWPGRHTRIQSWAPTCRPPGSTTRRRRAPAPTSTMRSPRLGWTESSSNGPSVSSG